MTARVQTKILKAKKGLMMISHMRMEAHFPTQEYQPTKGESLKTMLLENADEWMLACVHSIEFVSLVSLKFKGTTVS